ncbi:hypothetical protein [Gemycircularvirus HV-GcV2]|uniref:Uncharacterized protein n=1 Tax=Gemycircularvirus HV-GcV2 TaxID=1862825 RepID=A0A193CDU4_9VIRU|nr:hypothetical protein [Gemycircularvirus HV-GcV2]ANN22657.1 hypothetical protein [Gemycircularvirus HV-GcV2]
MDTTTKGDLVDGTLRIQVMPEIGDVTGGAVVGGLTRFGTHTGKRLMTDVASHTG